MSPRLAVLPGVAACVAIAIVARLLASSVGLGVETTLALVLGIAVGLLPGVRERLRPGVKPVARSVLRVGVALLGARLTLGAIIDGGVAASIAVIAIVGLGLVLGGWAARTLIRPERLGWLIAVGMAVCGNSAILALSPIVKADERETSYAVSTITLFGLISVLLLPVLGTALGLGDATFGMWAGLSVNDTAQVVATGYAFSPAAGDAATIVKLTRNLAIAPILIGATFLVASERPRSVGGAVASAVPWFVVGFVALAGLRSLGILDVTLPTGVALWQVLSDLAGWAILTALAAVGLSTDLRAIVRLGPRPLLVGVVLWVAIVLAGLLLAVALAG
jgi:uncharacterized integral membrane protein (TIGR00698 family)